MTHGFIQRMRVSKKFDKKIAIAIGNFPIQDQGKSGFIGFHEEAPGVGASLDTPIVVFANHIRHMQLITFDFSAIESLTQ